MEYKIVVDSCCDLTEKYKNDPHYQVIPLTLEAGGRTFVDDETFDQLDYLQAVAADSEVARTACPSPEAYMRAYEGDADMVFVVTLSRHLSGSYESAELGRTLFYEENPDSSKKIHVFSSDSAAAGESIIAFKLQELSEKGLDFEEIVEHVSSFRDNMLTYFVLDNLDTLRKNGRLTGFAALIATTLHIKPVMRGNHGVIEKADQCRGIQKALAKLADHIAAECDNPQEKILSISHVNCPERAQKVMELICSRISGFKDIYIVNAAGVTTTYANDGGIVVSV